MSISLPFLKIYACQDPSTPYKPAKRVAEIFVKRSTNNKWLLYISRIGFFNPADTLNDFSDNIVIVEPKKQPDSFDPIDGNKPEEKSLAGNAENESTTKAFNDKMADGNKAFADHNYVLARDAFLEALVLRPSDEAPRIMLAKLPMGQMESKMDPSDKFNQYIEQASLEEKRRNYQTAITLYYRAIDLDPTKRNSMKAR